MDEQDPLTPWMRLKRTAHIRLKMAIRDGSLVRPENCEQCGKLCVVHGHHYDYTKWISVRWLCCKCHRGEHARLKREGISLVPDPMPEYIR